MTIDMHDDLGPAPVKVHEAMPAGKLTVFCCSWIDDTAIDHEPFLLAHDNERYCWFVMSDEVERLVTVVM